MNVKLSFRLFSSFVLSALTLLLLAGTAAAAPANYIYVNNLEDGWAWDGTCNLRKAVLAANQNRAIDGCAAGSEEDWIRLDPSLEQVTMQLTEGALYINSHIVIDASQHGSFGDMVIDGNNQPMFTVRNGNLSLINGMILTNAGSPYSGAAVNAVNSDLSMFNVALNRNASGGNGTVYFNGGDGNLLFMVDTVFEYNFAQNGGGLAIEGGRVELENVVISHNEALHRGGGLYMSNGDVESVDLVLAHNTARWGGGFYKRSTNGTFSIQQPTITHNTATQDGGGVFWEGGERSDLVEPAISHNTADRGAGIYTRGWNGAQGLTVVQGSIFANHARAGGGVYNESGVVAILSGSLQDNTATDALGGGLYNQYGESLLIFTVLYNNRTNGLQNAAGTVRTSEVHLISNSGANCVGDIIVQPFGDEPPTLYSDDNSCGW